MSAKHAWQPNASITVNFSKLRKDKADTKDIQDHHPPNILWKTIWGEASSHVAVLISINQYKYLNQSLNCYV